MKINLKKKSHVKGYALRGAGLRKQVTLQCMLRVFFLMSIILLFSKENDLKQVLSGK